MAASPARAGRAGRLPEHVVGDNVQVGVRVDAAVDVVDEVEHGGRRPDKAARRVGYRHETEKGTAMAASPAHAGRTGRLPKLVVGVDVQVEVRVEATVVVVDEVEHGGRRPGEAARRLGYRHETEEDIAMAASPAHVSRPGRLPELVKEVDVEVVIMVEAAVVDDVEHGGRKPTPQVDTLGCRRETHLAAPACTNRRIARPRFASG